MAALCGVDPWPLTLRELFHVWEIVKSVNYAPSQPSHMMPSDPTAEYNARTQRDANNAVR